MAVVRIEALRGLENEIACVVPELRGQICVGQAAASHTLAFPSLVLDPRRWTYFPDQADEGACPSPGSVVMNVGRHEADIQIRIGAATLYQRYELEQKILDLFLATPLHPGVLFSQILSCPDLGSWTAAWELDTDEWRDEKAFDQQFYSLITVKGIIPALVTRGSAHTIQQLQSGLDITPTPSDGSPPSFAPPVEIVQINADGSIGPVP